MELQLTEKQFRRLLDLVYIGNWVLNSARGEDRIRPAPHRGIRLRPRRLDRSAPAAPDHAL